MRGETQLRNTIPKFLMLRLCKAKYLPEKDVCTGKLFRRLVLIASLVHHNFVVEKKKPAMSATFVSRSHCFTFEPNFVAAHPVKERRGG